MPVKIGFIGVGGRAASHLAAVKAVEDAQIVAVTDIDRDRAKSAAEEHGATLYESSSQMLEKEPLDALYVCTPPAFHKADVVAAAQQGVNVFVEKPVAVSMADALAMQNAVDETGVIAAVGYQIRYLDTVAEVARALSERTIAMLNSHYYFWAPRGAWARTTALSGGQVVEQATHLVDLMRFWAGEVETVHAMYALRTLTREADFKTWDASVVNLRFKSGAVGSLACTYALFPRVPQNVRIDIAANELLVRFSYEDLQIHAPGESHTLQASGNPTAAAAAAFLRAVRTGDRSGIRSPLDDAVKTLAVTLAANQSAETGKPVNLAALGRVSPSRVKR